MVRIHLDFEISDEMSDFFKERGKRLGCSRKEYLISVLLMHYYDLNHKEAVQLFKDNFEEFVPLIIELESSQHV